nr:NifB/NifX family molybdenum-iron cluster-binding protein [Candidatus Sigynarchaeota archaeon]
MVIIGMPTVSDEGLRSTLDYRLGRCNYLTIVELDDGKVISVTTTTNPAAQAMGGAGTQSVQFIASKGVDLLVVGNIGPNAGAALQASNIKVFQPKNLNTPPITVEDIIEDFKNGRLVPMQGSNVSAHTGMGGGGGMGRNHG